MHGNPGKRFIEPVLPAAGGSGGGDGDKFLLLIIIKLVSIFIEILTELQSGGDHVLAEMIFGIRAVTLKIQVARFLIHFDLNGILARIAVHHADRPAVVPGQRDIPDTPVIVIGMPELDRFWIREPGIGKFVEEFGS